MFEKIKRAFVKILLFLSTGFVITVLALVTSSLISNKSALTLLGIVAAIGLLGKLTGFPSNYPYRNAIYMPSMIFGIGLFLLVNGMDKKEQEETLAALKAGNPAAYLSQLKESDNDKWFSELKELDPAGYQAEVMRRAEIVRQQELERLARAERRRKEAQPKIDALLSTLKDTHTDDFITNIEIYEQLVSLAPEDGSFKEKLEDYREKKRMGDAMFEHPEHFIKIENVYKTYNDYKMRDTIRFDLRNELEWPVKDIVIACDYYGASGTFLSREVNTLFDTIPEKGSLHVNDFEIGFEPDQSAQRKCIVAGAR